MAKADTQWLKLFTEFCRDLRISSKEVTSQDERGVKLKLWESQERFLRELAYGLEDGIRWFCFLKSRQLGVTTISVAIDVFWLAMHHNLIGALVSDTEKNRAKNRDLIERYVNSFPDGYFGESFTIERSNVNFIRFSNGSRLDLLVAGTRAKKSTSWGEGEGYAFVHCTEVAAYGDSDGLSSFMESFAQKNPDRLFIFESTAKGFNHFRDLWVKAKADTLTKRTAFLGWWSCEMNRIERNDPRFQLFGRYPASGDERDLVLAVKALYNHTIQPEQLAWIRWKPTDTTADDSSILDQNQPWVEKQAFIQSGHSFFQPRLIAQNIRALEEAQLRMFPYFYDIGNDFFSMKMERITDEKDRDRIELKVWEQPHPEGRYVIGCDPAFGRSANKDRHAIQVCRCYADKLVQVAEYATNGVEVKHCAWVLAHLAGAYRDCIVNLELTGPGRMVMQEWSHLQGSMKAEMYHQQVREMGWEDAMDNARWYLYHRPDSVGSGYCYNFETTWRTKQEIFHQMKGSYMTSELVIRSFHLLSEMSVVVQDGEQIGAPESRSESCKDDRVFAMALAIRAWLNWQKLPMITQGLTYQSITDRESGEMGMMQSRLNDMVFKFFKRKQTEAEEAEEQDDSPAWMKERGLV